jgi:hypothetical protein
MVPNSWALVGLRRLGLALALLLLLSGCHRKAPGPEECLALAYRIYGVQTQADLAIQNVQANVDELTTECLLTPYDRELLACVEQTGTLRPCQRAFVLRHGGVDVASRRVRPPRRRPNPSYP